MRLFVAIPLEEAARVHLVTTMRRLDELARSTVPALQDIRWVPAANLHGTLRFLGEVDDAAVPAVIKALQQAAGGGAFSLFAQSVALQPPRGPRRLVAAELGGEVEPLKQLHTRVDQAMASLGFPKERRRLWPHVTLGRWRRPARVDEPNLQDEVKTRSPFPGPNFRVERIELMQSHLRPTGAEYAVVTTVPLGATA